MELADGSGHRERMSQEYLWLAVVVTSVVAVMWTVALYMGVDANFATGIALTLAIGPHIIARSV